MASGRFSVLEIDSEDEERNKKIAAEKAKNAEKNAKKRARKKKKAQTESANTNELRSLAFAKPISAAAIQSIHQKNHPIPTEEKQNKTPVESYCGGKSFRNVPTDNNYEDWEEWKTKDEEYVSGLFQKDLQAALRISSEEMNQATKSVESRSVKKKSSKKPTMSFDEFAQMTSIPTSVTNTRLERVAKPVNGYYPEEIDPNHFELHPVLEQPLDKDKNTKKHNKKKKKQPTESKTTLSDVLNTTTDNNTRKSSLTNIQETDTRIQFRLASYQNDLQEKDKEIQTLKNNRLILTEELEEVKKRNKQLCFIIAQGEMKEKSELIQQVEELNNVKNELSSEVEKMYSALEQERSKVSHLQNKLQKYQNTRLHSKSLSEDV